MKQSEYLSNRAKRTRYQNTTRERILSTALAEFAQSGLSGARIDRIARKAGVNKAMIYYHFSSKQALYEQVIKEHISTIVATIHEAVTASDTLEETLKTFAEVYSSLFSSTPEFARILLRELADSESQIIRLLADTIASSGLPKQVMNLLQTGVAQGRFRTVNVRQALVSFVLMNVGYSILSPLVDKIWGIADREQFLANRKEAVIDLFLEGVKTR